MYICPVCKKMLIFDDKKSTYGTLVCENNHSFDYSKKGYVNLLLSDKMHSKTPGDNKLMIDAREAFLKKDYYKPLCDEIITTLRKFNHNTILDAGCGEGYYTSNISEGCKECSALYGVDISKNALVNALRKDKKTKYAVASLFNLPFSDESFDVVLNIFAPYAHSEFLRVLKMGGVMMLVIPDENHLFELKELLYDTPYKNEVKAFEIADFEFLFCTDVSFKMNIQNSEDLVKLFMMTPYYYRTPKEKALVLEKINSISISAEFKILVYKK